MFNPKPPFFNFIMKTPSKLKSAARLLGRRAAIGALFAQV
jgi:hypothetical protein